MKNTRRARKTILVGENITSFTTNKRKHLPPPPHTHTHTHTHISALECTHTSHFIPTLQTENIAKKYSQPETSAHNSIIKPGIVERRVAGHFVTKAASVKGHKSGRRRRDQAEEQCTSLPVSNPDRGARVTDCTRLTSLCRARFAASGTGERVY